MAHDYKEVALDTVVESRKRPGKASAYLSCELLSSNVIIITLLYKLSGS